MICEHAVVVQILEYVMYWAKQVRSGLFLFCA